MGGRDPPNSACSWLAVALKNWQEREKRRRLEQEKLTWYCMQKGLMQFFKVTFIGWVRCANTLSHFHIFAPFKTVDILNLIKPTKTHTCKCITYFILWCFQPVKGNLTMHWSEIFWCPFVSFCDRFVSVWLGEKRTSNLNAVVSDTQFLSRYVLL